MIDLEMTPGELMGSQMRENFWKILKDTLRRTLPEDNYEEEKWVSLEAQAIHINTVLT